MKKPTVYVVMGYSGSGKDTIAGFLKEAKVVKFAAPGKRALEFMFGLPEGFYEDREARMQIAPHCQGRTYLKVLMDFYHHRKLVIGEDLFTSQTLAEIEKRLADGQDVVVTDVRNINEGQVIEELLKTKDFTLEVIWIESRNGKMLSTDELQHRIYESLTRVACRFTVLGNYGTKEDLHNSLKARGLV